MGRADDVRQIIDATLLYARGLDLFDPDEALSAYTDDAYWDATAVGLKRFEGRDEIHGFFEADAEAMAEQFHIMTNHIVEFDGPDTAHGTNYVFSEGKTKSGASIKAIALNRDEYRRVGDTWKISGRAISPLTTPQMEGFDA
ncbi:nuclear transport factor 2 family protein [Pseudonocardia kujensis]|uniref:nuclear transport factor 2 family protein n=1 Tax=Pseudonocardia kujensis TaxID=1128675 RepID=UPI001E3C186D|nr:nuclear transport factor 2 family protein [Pseudonocardia kujensis]MCE0764655.1 nuclear transport factor 2 family protein [Pseudonocardia kujensis]